MGEIEITVITTTILIITTSITMTTIGDRGQVLELAQWIALIPKVGDDPRLRGRVTSDSRRIPALFAAGLR